MAKILLVDDNPQNIELLSLRLEAAGHDTMETKDGEEALLAVAEAGPDLMILDLQMPKVDGLQVLKQLQEDRRDIPVIVISAFATVERAVEAMKAGALDFITKPFDPTHLELVVERALERRSLENQNRFLTEELNARYHFVLGKSPGMAKAYEVVVKAAESTEPVLIDGEGGTGKEVAARAIHRESARAESSFLILRCASLTPEQQEHELFGGADKRGSIELGAGGTLFLDEVGKLSPAVQEKLLHTLNTHGFTRTGGTTMIPADVRVIASTTVDLAKGSGFNKDLLAKLTTFSIHLPALRDRREDIGELAGYFAEKFSREIGGELKTLSEEALESLATYHWPGNVRELANIIERAASTGGGEEITVTDLGLAVRGMLSVPNKAASGQLTGTYHELINAFRREVILSALRESQGETDGAAEALGLSKDMLDRLLVLHKIRK